MKPTAMVIVFFALPFAISAAFYFSPWLGWPALLVLGSYWIGNLILIKEQTNKESDK